MIRTRVRARAPNLPGHDGRGVRGDADFPAKICEGDIRGYRSIRQGSSY